MWPMECGRTSSHSGSSERDSQDVSGQRKQRSVSRGDPRDGAHRAQWQLQHHQGIGCSASLSHTVQCNLYDLKLSYLYIYPQETTQGLHKFKQIRKLVDCSSVISNFLKPNY